MEVKDVLTEILITVGYSVLCLISVRKPEVLIIFQTGEEQLLWRFS